MSGNSKPRHRSLFGSPDQSPVSIEDDENEVTSSDDAASPTIGDRQIDFSDKLLSDAQHRDTTLQSSDDQDESNEEGEDMRFDEESNFTSKLKDLGERQKWLSYTKKERAIVEEISELDARDLTTHILNAHGITAKQYAPQLGHLGEPGYSSTENTTYDRFDTRAENVPGWVPRVNWTRWPLKPSTVPRKQQKVWATSLTKSETWKPSGELEQCLFAFLLRTARSQWDNRANGSDVLEKSSEPDVKKTKIKVDQESYEDVDEYATTDAEAIQGSNQKNSKEEEHDEGNLPTFSADDEKSWRILKPVTRSTITALDKVLTTLHKSQSRVKYYSRASSTPGQPPALRRPMDWSQVLGFAAIAGISSAVISRAATRCTAALNESMSFTLLREDQQSISDTTPHEQPLVPRPIVYTPTSIHTNSDPNSLLHDSPMHYDITQGCPFSTCRWHGRLFPFKATTLETGHARLTEHMRRAHYWFTGTPADLEANVTGMVGGVHVDGYLQPVVPKHGWRGSDRNERASKASGTKKRKREMVDGKVSSSVGAESSMRETSEDVD